ncbi:RNA polymerase II C-terminal domain phosphatase-like 4 [Punica granatum]|uniref:RNA polymerase II C-terminal domain phosphatase-like 4 n=2 Tax=Punica granatum TaxID=22663 RepID=A0A6P8EMY2_PUNGR|nr:RNA polymerase II C-terminal domain phosphatase-like 4 [Punica granatum]PKI76707.1 hypothetical protein CRG98_002875 [Punica granatum]
MSMSSFDHKPSAVPLVPFSGEDAVQETLLPLSNMRKIPQNLPLLHCSGPYMIDSLCSILEKASSLEPEVGCTHPLMYKGTCLACKECMGDWCGLQLDYLEPGFRVGRKEVGQLRESISRNLLGTRKLHLILDLDNTLLHTISCSALIPDEQHLLAECHVPGKTTGDLFVDPKGIKITKLRPFVLSLLREASTMFDLTLYTTGTRSYADRMVHLLDPEGCYFGNWVIARSDLTSNYKSLDNVLAKEYCTLILDDDSEAWPKHTTNLIPVEPYNYFFNDRSTYRKDCPPQNPDGEGERPHLAIILDVLKAIHQRYFDQYDHGKGGLVDVRTELLSLRRDVLKGCRIFTGRADWVTEMARQLGATIVWEPSSSVTHVISESSTCTYARWALQQNKFLVHPEWVFAAYRLWKRPAEHEFLLKAPRKYRGW